VIRSSGSSAPAGYRFPRGVIMAWQEVIARHLELLLLHHARKASQDGQRHHTLDDVYGSTWLTSGQGSVIALDGEPGDPTVELRHLKQPAAPVGPLRIRHDHSTGTSTVVAEIDLLDLLVGAGDAGVTAQQAADVVIGRTATKDLQKIRRELRKLVGDGLVQKIPGRKTAGGAEPDRWAATGRPCLPTDFGGMRAEGLDEPPFKATVHRGLGLPPFTHRLHRSPRREHRDVCWVEPPFMPLFTPFT